MYSQVANAGTCSASATAESPASGVCETRFGYVVLAGLIFTV